MKISIKYKLYITFILALLLFSFTVVILSNIFLDDFIINANKKLIDSVFIENKQLFTSDNININKLVKISTKNDVGIAIYENENIEVCSSLFLCGNNQTNIPSYISKYLPSVKDFDKRLVIIKLELLNVNEMVYIYNLSNGKYVIFNKGLDSITSINNIIKPIITILSLLIFSVGSIIVYFIANKITRPISKISKYANEIAQLNFDNKLNIKSNDELEILANSMNEISIKLASALKKLQDDLEKEKVLDRKRVKFFTTVSHELKTPITIIQGYAEGIKHNIVKSKEDLNEYCTIIIDESKKMNNLVNQLLDLSLYDSGKFHLKKEKFDIFDLTKSFAVKYLELIYDKQINYEINSNREEVFVFADKNRIEQVIRNLLSNACKYAKKDGIIKITIIECESSVKVSFYNNGEKIEDDELNNIWDIFYKIEDSKHNIGSGLGLAIVKSIITMHNGDYGARNKEIGVEFYFEIPK